MFKYRIWNKTDNVGKATAEYLINKYKITDNDDLIVISDDDTDVEISNVKLIKQNYSLPQDLTSLEVGEEYIKILNKANENKEPNEKEIMQEKISILEEENANINYVLMIRGLI